MIWRSGTASPVPRNDARPSIAVLPLTNVSGRTQDVALVDGLTEELIAMLARIGNLRVIGRTSAFAFKGSTAGTRRIADSLGVANILEGSAQREGTRLRVQVRLLSSADGTTRWAQTYDRELTDIFTVQSDIAGEVARALDVRLGAGQLPRAVRHGTTNVAAYEQYLRGNDAAVTRSDSGADAGLAHFRRAVALDSNYAAAYAGMSRLYMRSPSIDGKRVPFAVRRDSALRVALKAVALDDSLGEAHASLGLLKKMQYDFAGAERELRRATILEPDNARFHEWLVQLYVVLARPDEALVHGRRAVELDPLSATANAELANALMADNRCDDALAVLDRLKGLKPPLLRAGGIAAQCYARRGMWSRALEMVQQVHDTSARTRALSGYLLARSGRTVDARRTLATLLDQSAPGGGTAFDIGFVYAGLGDNDRAFEWLDKAVSDQTFTLEWFPTIADRLQSDPRFLQLRRHLGVQKR
jgi:TolB-like protein/Flp pilus assembly protein TadD